MAAPLQFVHGGVPAEDVIAHGALGAMAARMAGVGRVTVSLRRSIMEGKLERMRPADRRSAQQPVQFDEQGQFLWR